MESLMSKFTGIFSQITVVTPQTIVQPQQQEKADEGSSPKSQSQPTLHELMEENAIVAEEFVAEELARVEDHSQHSDMIEYEYLADSQDEEVIVEETFPLQTMENLETVERKIKESIAYKEKLKSELHQIREGMGSESCFTNIIERIIERELLHGFNWYGFKGKKGLHGYTLFNELLVEIYEKMHQGEEKNFVKDMNVAIAQSHRRKNNQLYRKRRKGCDSEGEESKD